MRLLSTHAVVLMRTYCRMLEHTPFNKQSGRVRNGCALSRSEHGNRRHSPEASAMPREHVHATSGQLSSAHNSNPALRSTAPISSETRTWKWAGCVVPTNVQRQAREHSRESQVPTERYVHVLCDGRARSYVSIEWTYQARAFCCGYEHSTELGARQYTVHCCMKPWESLCLCDRHTAPCCSMLCACGGPQKDISLSTWPHNDGSSHLLAHNERRGPPKAHRGSAIQEAHLAHPTASMHTLRD